MLQGCFSVTTRLSGMTSGRALHLHFNALIHTHCIAKTATRRRRRTPPVSRNVGGFPLLRLLHPKRPQRINSSGCCFTQLYRTRRLISLLANCSSFNATLDKECCSNSFRNSSETQRGWSSSIARILMLWRNRSVTQLDESLSNSGLLSGSLISLWNLLCHW